MASHAALADALGENVKASFLLRCSAVQEEAVFLVLSTTNLHVVDLDLSGPRGKGGVHLQSPLVSISDVVVPETDNEAFTLQCSAGVRMRRPVRQDAGRPASRQSPSLLRRT